MICCLIEVIKFGVDRYESETDTNGSTNRLGRYNEIGIIKIVVHICMDKVRYSLVTKRRSRKPTAIIATRIIRW